MSDPFATTVIRATEWIWWNPQGRWEPGGVVREPVFKAPPGYVGEAQARGVRDGYAEFVPKGWQGPREHANGWRAWFRQWFELGGSGV